MRSLKMLKRIGVVLFVAALTNQVANAQDYVWVKKLISQRNENLITIAGMELDNHENMIVAGMFNDTVTIGNILLTAHGILGKADCFLAKLDSAGNVLWAKNFGGNYDDGINCIKVDQQGNIYCGGYFYGISFYFENYTANSQGSSDGNDNFILKTDVNGNLLWLHNGGTSIFESQHVCNINIGNYDQVFITFFRASQITLNDSIVDGLILAEYNSSGILKRFAAYPSFSASANIYLDTQTEQLYLGGGYLVSIILGYDTLLASDYGGTGANFCCRLDTNLNIIWVIPSKGIGDVLFDQAHHNLLLLAAGNFPAVFDTIGFGSYNYLGSYLCSVDSSGAFDYTLLTQTFPYPEEYYFSPSGNLHMSNGIYNHCFIFNDTITPGIPSTLVYEIDSSISEILYYQYFGKYDCSYSGVTTRENQNGQFYFVSDGHGSCIGGGTIAYGNFVDSISDYNYRVAYVGKLKKENFVGITSIPIQNKLLLYPVPARDAIRIYGLPLTSTQLVIVDLFGRTLKQVSATGETTLDISGLASGFYLLKSEAGTTPFIKE